MIAVVYINFVLYINPQQFASTSTAQPITFPVTFWLPKDPMTVQCALNLEFFLDYRVEILSMTGFGATPIMVQLGGLVTK